MARDDERFEHSGPTHLTAMDWTNPEHRRSAAASLVKGVRVLDRDNVQSRVGPQALAPPWWEFFHFQLIDQLVDEKNYSIFGAIFEFKYCRPSYITYSHLNPPKYVVAFRGTVKKHLRDIKYNALCVMDMLDGTRRFRQTMDAVEKIVSESGAANVWLAGHSLGSAFALKVGKNMFRKEGPIETYLFNPPSMTISVEQINSETFKNLRSSIRNVTKAGASMILNSRSQRHEREESFENLSGWTPNMFLNRLDPICGEYISYFEDRAKTTEKGKGKIAKLAEHTSVLSLLTGPNGEDLVPLPLLPSAHLTINESPSKGFKEAHGIKQWWQPNIQRRSKLYLFFNCQSCGFVHSADFHFYAL